MVPLNRIASTKRLNFNRKEWRWVKKTSTKMNDYLYIEIAPDEKNNYCWQEANKKQQRMVSFKMDTFHTMKQLVLKKNYSQNYINISHEIEELALKGITSTEINVLFLKRIFFKRTSLKRVVWNIALKKLSLSKFTDWSRSKDLEVFWRMDVQVVIYSSLVKAFLQRNFFIIFT